MFHKSFTRTINMKRYNALASMLLPPLSNVAAVAIPSPLGFKPSVAPAPATAITAISTPSTTQKSQQPTVNRPIMGASASAFQGRGAWGALAFYLRSPGYYPLCLKSVQQRLASSGGTLADMQIGILEDATKMLEYYGRTILGNTSCWEEYINGSTALLLEAPDKERDPGWEYWAPVEEPVSPPDGEEIVLHHDANGVDRQLVGQFEDLPNLLWLLGIPADTPYDQASMLHMAKLQELEAAKKKITHDDDGGPRPEPVPLTGIEMTKLFLLPEELPCWDKAPEGGMSYDDLWDMMKERGQPISKGLMVTGYEHISLMPLCDLAFGSLGSVSGACVRDLSIEANCPYTRPVQAQQMWAEYRATALDLVARLFDNRRNEAARLMLANIQTDRIAVRAAGVDLVAEWYDQSPRDKSFYFDRQKWCLCRLPKGGTPPAHVREPGLP